MNLPPKGEINGTNFIDILKDAAQSALTGMIRLENERIVKVVYLQKGAVSFASSNEKTDRLTEVLKRGGKLTPEQVEDAQARLKPNVSIGKTLVELGYISARDLLWGARAQVDHILHQMLFWNQGKYQVQEGALPKEIIHLNLPIPAIIFDGIMKTQNREWILQHIGSPDAIYELSEDFRQQNEILKLPVNEIASHLNGKRSLHDIAEKSEMDTFEICKTVVALECLDLARTIQDQPLQMDLSAPESDQPQEILQEVEQPIDRLELNDVAPAKLEEPEPVQTQNEEESSPIVAAVEPVLELQPVEQTLAAPGEEQPEIADRIILVPRDEPESAPRWKTPIFTILLIVAVALAIYFYMQHQEAVPTPAPVTAQPARKSREAKAEIPNQPVPGPQETKSPAPAELELDSPLRMLQDGKTREASEQWHKNLLAHNFGYTIQLVIACQDKTVQDTYRMLNYSKEIIVLPLNFKGQDCYRVLYGQFRAREYAQSAVPSLPEVFRKQPSPPTVISFSKVL